MRVRIYVGMPAYTFERMNLYVCIYIYIYMCVCVRVCVCVCVYYLCMYSETRLSVVIWTASHPDMQNMLIIVFF
jgi:hypothetical protein